MQNSLKKKKKNVLETIKKINTISVIIITEYSGINTNQLTKFRFKSKENNICMFVLKNTLMIRVIKNTKFQHLKNYIKDQIVFFISNDIILISKIILNFLKENENLKFKIGSYLGKSFTKLDLVSYASIPNKNTLIIQLLNIFRYSIVNFIKILLFLKKNK